MLDNYKTKFVKTTLPCPCGKSSDAYSIDPKGHGFCFSCNKYFRNKDSMTQEWKPEINVEYVYSAHRGLSVNTLRFYDVKSVVEDGQVKQTLYKYKGGQTVTRFSTDGGGKRFTSNGIMSDVGLWGLDKFDAGSKKSITICEGREDAMSIYQITGGETAAVAVRSSASARSDIKTDFDKINSFDRIILAFDNDEPGQNAARAVASMFDFKKVYQVKLDRYKDPNEYLQKNEGALLLAAWKGQRKYTPDDIISGFNDIREALNNSAEDRIGEYPIKTLNTMLKGLHKGEIVVFKGDEGIGKTEIFRMMEYHLLSTTNYPIGIVHLEEDNSETIKSIATYHSKKPMNVEDAGFSLDDIFKNYTEAVKNDEGKLFIHSSFEVEDEDVFFSNIRFLGAVCGCQFIFFDHITWLATGKDDENERRKLDRISQRLKLLAKELRVCIIMISHTNDEGKTRGSRNITKAANTVVHMSRDIINADEIERSKTWLTIEKARTPGAKAGPAGYVIFNSEGNYLEDASEKKVPGL